MAKKNEQTRPAANKMISRDFNEQTFECKCSKMGPATCNGMLPDGIDQRLVKWLQKLTEKAGTAFVVMSGYRCAAYAKRQGAPPRNFETKGQAVRGYLKGVSLNQLNHLAEEALKELRETDPEFKNVGGCIRLHPKKNYAYLDVRKFAHRETAKA